MNENLTSCADSRISGGSLGLVGVQILRESATECPRNSTRIPHKRPANSAKRREDGKNHERKNAHEIKESRTTYSESTRWSDYGQDMTMTVTQFKARCLGVIDRVQKEKTRVTITRHGRPAAELVPVSASSPGKLFGRAKKTTVILGDLMSTGEPWHAED
jgi:prevent-host-death family protein